MNIELSGTCVLISICLLVFSILVLIKAVRAIYLLRKEEGNLQSTEGALLDRNKYLSVSPMKNSGFNLKIGMVCSLAFVLLSFSWTTYLDDEIIIWQTDFDEILPIEPPSTVHAPPPPPPPPPPNIEEVPPELIPEEEEFDFVDQDVEEESFINDAPIEKASGKPLPIPPPPPDIIEDIEDVFVIVEQMPRFPGCENMVGTKIEKKICADKRLLEYIYSNLEYPRIAMENGVEGTVVLQFVINKEGRVSDLTLARGIGAGCDEAAAEVIRDINKLPEGWTPGRQRGRKVNVKYTLPIKFKLLK